MSTNWGGLLDIGPGPSNICKKDSNGICDLWIPPHSNHGDGKNVDIGFGFGKKIPIYKDDNLRLLKDVILDPIRGLSLPYSNEGGSNFIPADHFHVRFPN